MSNSGGRVAVLGGDGGIGAAVITGLVEAGYDAVAVADDDLGTATRVTAIVDAGFVRGLPTVGELASLPADAWLRNAEEPLRRALHVMQRAHECLRDRGGRLVVLLPSLIMSGAPGVVAWAAAAEGYRSLAKAAARAWGNDGITIKCVLVPATLIDDELHERPGLQPPALGRTPDLHADVAPAIAALLDPRLDPVTGVTVAVDGGVWMTS